ncbi:UNVERIFIED_CONTAM: hypothetical protein HDU68_006675 [Siphonaria sp. JEL0065]|nr:hypothetical protein HDU68_006675 [Siphonaria sp. JEL0065]
MWRRDQDLSNGRPGITAPVLGGLAHIRDYEKIFAFYFDDPFLRPLLRYSVYSGHPLKFREREGICMFSKDDLIREDRSLASRNSIPKLRTLTRERARDRGNIVYDEMAKYLMGLSEFAESQSRIKEAGVWSTTLMNYLRNESAKLALPDIVNPADHKEDVVD